MTARSCRTVSRRAPGARALDAAKWAFAVRKELYGIPDPGGLEAEAGGKRLELGGPREQKVLAVLLLDAGRVVPVTHLAEALWDDPPATAGKQVRNTVGLLRRLLAENGATAT